MKQIIQHLKSGEIEVAEVPVPVCTPGKILIRTARTLISTGTEKMLVEFARASYIEKARKQPEKVKQVLDKIKTDGLLATTETIFAKLDEPMPLGYCNVGEVIEVGDGTIVFQVGDRVASNGSHAEYVLVPQNLCAKIPDMVTWEEAVFTILGSIGLQGVRLAEPTIGETFVVTGLGLVGLLTAQILIANGCQVIGFDVNSERINLAERLGIHAYNVDQADPITIALSLTEGRGVDGVIIAASSKSNEPVSQAAHMCRKRGRIVLVGVTGLEINRSDFYEKELSFQVSCSYGPGRYDENYEQRGHDYPFGFIRWTEQRNFEAVLQLISSERIHVKPLISDIIEISNAKKAYEKITTNEPVSGIVLSYPSTNPITRMISTDHVQIRTKECQAVVGVIGAGNFAKMMLMPALCKTPARLKTVVDLNSVSAIHAARKFSFENSTTDYQTILDDSDINTIFITTRHNLHAKFVIDSLNAGKNVYVEKPLAMNADELNQIQNVYRRNNLRLMVGFNRRFSPFVQQMKDLLYKRTDPISIDIIVNAGAIPSDHWVHDRLIGGGRIIGEGCHFIDLMTFLADSEVVSVSAFSMGHDQMQDKVSISIQLSDGSIGTVHYWANGCKKYPKESIHLFSSGRVLELVNFRELLGYGWKSFSKMKRWKQDKGHSTEMTRFIDCIQSGQEAPIPFRQLINTTRASFAVLQSLEKKEIIHL